MTLEKLREACQYEDATSLRCYKALSAALLARIELMEKYSKIKPELKVDFETDILGKRLMLMKDQSIEWKDLPKLTQDIFFKILS